MDSARFARDEHLYAAVIQHLVRNCTGITSSSCMDLAVTAAMHTVHCAIADFSQSWNARSLSLLPALPNELLVVCFEHLPQRWLVTASGVSRGWRTVLLGTPNFWTRIYVNVLLTDILAVRRLQNMIQRSGSALLDVIWARPIPMVGMKGQDLRRVVLDLFTKSMSRIRSLDIHAVDMDAILNAPAPCLQALSIYEGGTIASIPAGWSNSNAPVLRSLSMRAFNFPRELVPLRNMEVFRGGLHPRGSLEARTIFQLFPGLRDLSLYNVDNAAQLPELAPPTLSRIHLSASSGGDFDAVLANWTHYPRHASRSFILSTDGPLALDVAMQHLARVRPSAAPDISIRCRGLEITLSTPGKYEIELSSSHRQSRVYDGWVALGRSAHIGAIRALHLTDTMLMPVLRADLEFPSVTEMSILAGAAASKSEINMAFARNPPALRVPQLRTLTFEIVKIPRMYIVEDLSTAARLPQFVAKYIRHGSRKLESVTIVGPRRPAWEHVRGLLADAEALYYCAGSSDNLQEMSPPLERNVSPDDVWDEEALNAVAALLTAPDSA